MGGTLDKVGNVFNPGSMDVNGTGQTVDDLKKIGYSGEDIKSLGGGQPNMAQRMLRGGLGGLATGLNGQQRNQNQQSSASTPIPTTPAPTMETGFNPNYLDQWRQQMMMNPTDPNAAFYGR